MWSRGAARWGTALFATLVAVLGIASPAAAAKRRSHLVTYKLVVSYPRPICGGLGERPLDSAPIVFERKNKEVARKTLSRTGTVSVRLAQKPTDAWVRYSDKSIRVLRFRDKIPPGGTRGVDYLKLGAIHPGRNVFHVAPSDSPTANVWSVLQANVRFAEPLTVRPLRLLFVRVSGANTQGDLVNDYSVPDRLLSIVKPDIPNAFADANGIAHEFGHYLMFENIAEAAGQSGSHIPWYSYPDRPALAFYEGWAEAYAAAEQRTSIYSLGFGCPRDPFLDLGAPTLAADLETPRQAQFSEEAAAYVIYQLAGYLGGGNVGDGLRQILHAYATQQVNGRTPETMRDLRDALEGDGIGSSNYEKFFKVSEIFGNFGMSWGIGVQFIPDPDRSPHFAHPGTTIRLTGPDGFDCRSEDPSFNEPATHGPVGDITPVGAFGPNGFVWQDDCIANGSSPVSGPAFDADGYSPRDASIHLDFPFLSGGAEQKSPYDVSYLYTCVNTSDDQDGSTGIPNSERHCKDTLAGKLIIDHSPLPQHDGPVDLAPESVQGEDGNPTVVDVEIPRDQTTDLVQFDAAGRSCTVPVAGNRPC